MHTFDGAHGADLACLIRRVKERGKAPRGQLVCVGTSATLGDGGPDMARELADYATRVFGEPFGEDGLIGESVLAPDEFLKGCLIKYVQMPVHERKAELDPLRYETLEAYVRGQHRLWLGQEIGERLVDLPGSLAQKPRLSATCLRFWRARPSRRRSCWARSKNRSPASAIRTANTWRYCWPAS
ncbi:MAG: hypothetical protein ACLQU1_33205 [Bryobacteraceae bacterium]